MHWGYYGIIDADMKVISIFNQCMLVIAANEYNMGVLVPVPSATAAILRNPIPDQQSRDPQCRESNLETAMKQALFNMADGFKLASHRLDIRGSLGFGKLNVSHTQRFQCVCHNSSR